MSPNAVVPPALARKLREARLTGLWIVEDGEHLYRIARLLTTDDAEAARLARELHESNAGAFVNGDPGRIVAGARLLLPPRVMGEPMPGTRAPASQERATVQSAPPATAAAPPAPPAPPATAAAPPALPPAAPATAASVPTVPAQAAAPAPYVDRLMSSGLADAEDPADDRVSRDTSPGLRTTSIEYRLDHRDRTQAGATTSQGLGLRHRRETERHGDFTLEAEVGHERLGRLGTRSVGRATLYHDQFALGDAWLANSAVGAIRLGPSPWLASSHRIYLPSSIAAGATTTLDSPTTQLRLGAGRLARLSGLAIQHLDTIDGTLAQLEATTRLSESWQVGGAAVALRDAQGIRDHAAITLASEWRLPVSGASIKLQGILDDDREHAVWADGSYRQGRYFHRFGLFDLSPRVVFGEGALARDSRGAYYRGEYRGPDTTITMGTEAQRTNLERDSARGGMDSAGAYGTVALKLDRSTQVGGGLSSRHEKPRTPTGTRRDVHLLSAFLGRTWALGFTRLDASLNLTRPQAFPSESIRTYTWSQDWPRFASIELSTLVSLAEERLAERNLRRTTAGVTLRGPAFSSVRWDASVTYVDVDDGIDSERNYNAVLGLDWSPARDWTLRLQWLRNQIEPAAPNALIPFVRENTVQVFARWEDARGTPYPRVATATGRSGTGWIEGSVFFDENNDGARQANERGAANVVVVLDGRATQVTDASGRYGFGIVAAGEHAITLTVDKVPLPWGLADDAARKVRVEVREGARVDIPLTRIAP